MKTLRPYLKESILDIFTSLALFQTIDCNLKEKIVGEIDIYLRGIKSVERHLKSFTIESSCDEGDDIKVNVYSFFSGEVDDDGVHTLNTFRFVGNSKEITVKEE